MKEKSENRSFITEAEISELTFSLKFGDKVDYLLK